MLVYQVSDFNGDDGKKLWLSLDKATRRMLLEKWLLERGCPKYQISDLLKVHGTDDMKEMSRRNLLAYYFEDKFGSKPYLCLSPASKNTYRANKSRAKKKGNSIAYDALSSFARIPLNNISYSSINHDPVNTCGLLPNNVLCHTSYKSQTHLQNIPPLPYTSNKSHQGSKHCSSFDIFQDLPLPTTNVIKESVTTNGATKTSNIVRHSSENPSNQTLWRDSLLLYDYAISISNNSQDQCSKFLKKALALSSCPANLKENEAAFKIVEYAKTHGLGNGSRLKLSLKRAVERATKLSSKNSTTDDTMKITKDEYNQLKQASAICEKLHAFGVINDLQNDDHVNTAIAYAQMGRNAIQFLQLLQTKNENPSCGRRGDVKQHAFNAVLTSLMPNSLERSKFAISNQEIVKMISSHHRLVKKAKNNRIIFESDDKMNPCAIVEKQATRIDHITEIIETAVLDFCHDNEYSRIDSNCSRVYAVKSADGEKEKHARRNWANPGNSSAQYRRFLDSKYYRQLCILAEAKSPEYFSRNKEVAVSYSKFMDLICNCIKPKTHYSCADVIEDSLQCTVDCLKSWMSRITNFKQNTRQIEAIKAVNGGAWWYRMLMGPHSDVLSQLCSAALCEKESHSDLTLPNEPPFTLHSTTCVSGNCQHCSISNIPWGSPLFTECMDEVKCWIWKKQHDEDSFRIPIKETMIIKDVFSMLKDHLMDYISHSFNLRWQRRAMKLDQYNCKAGGKILYIFTDFASAINFKSPKSECCAHDPHGHMAVYLVLIGTEVCRSETDTHFIFTECHQWYGICATGEKGKKNDWITETSFLRCILQHYQNKARARDETLKGFIEWTDGCKGQYTGRQHDFQLALICDEFDLAFIDHKIAWIYGFKGTWDGMGKIAKNCNAKWEKEHDVYLYNAWMFFVVTRNRCVSEKPNKIDWSKLLAHNDPKLKSKTPLTSTDWFAMYATDSKDEYEHRMNRPTYVLSEQETVTEKIKIAAENSFIIFTDRERRKCNEDTIPIEASAKMHHRRYQRKDKFVAPTLPDEDVQSALEWLSNSSVYPLPDTTSKDIQAVADDLQAKAQNIISCQQTIESIDCEHCGKSMPPLTNLVHAIFCSNNPQNMVYPIMHRERACSCHHCSDGDEHLCKYHDITGAWNITNMMHLKQQLMRDCIRRMIKLVKDTKIRHDQKKASVLSMIQSKCPSFPLHIPCEDEIRQWPNFQPEEKGARLSSRDLLNATIFLELHVVGTGKNGNILKKDSTLALDRAGGWNTLVATYVSRYVNDANNY
jgi:hypothetical protein